MCAKVIRIEPQGERERKRETEIKTVPEVTAGRPKAECYTTQAGVSEREMYSMFAYTFH